MIILPAIDILGGKCVRLTKGDYGTAAQVAADPIETAKSFVAAGAEWIHMVDLDGAKSGSRVNSDIYTAVAKAVDCPIEVGGGIRDMETVDYYMNKGIARVIIGSAALTNPGLVKEAVERYGDRIAVGIDALNGEVKTSGWLHGSGTNYIDLARAMEAVGVDCVIFTDISKDGTLAGPNLEQLAALKAAVSMKIIASGGIRDIGNVLDCRALGVWGAICGKSIYGGTLDLAEAIRAAKE